MGNIGAARRRLLSSAAWLSFAVASTLTAGVASAVAQDTGVAANGEVKLTPIVVQADKKTERVSGDKAREAKVLTTTTTRAELDKAQVDSFEDLGQRVDAGVLYNPVSKSVVIRGLDENRVLTTLDGIPQPWLGDGARGVQGGGTLFDFDTLSSLDIVRGADSSVYGSGSLGGVVAVRTLDPEDILDDGRRFGGVTKGTYDSSDRQWKVDQALAAHVNDTWLLVQGAYGWGHETDNKGDVGGIGATRSEPSPADTRDRNLLFKLHQYVDGGHRFGFTGEIYDSRNDIDDLSEQGSTYEPGAYNRDEINKRKRLSFSYDYAAPSAGSLLDTAHAVFYWQEIEQDDNVDAVRITAPTGPYVRDSVLTQRTFGFTGTATKSIEIGGLENTFLFAADGALRKTTQGSTGEDSCDVVYVYTCNFLHTNQADMPETKGGNIGLALQDTIALPGGKVRIIPGVRFDYYRESPQATDAYFSNPNATGLPDASSGSKFSPKLRAEWDVAPETTLYAQWAQGFRAPSATELYLDYGGPGTYLAIGNPDLKPETVNGFEIGAKLGNDDLGGGVALYDNYYRNFIDEVSVSAAEAGVPAGTYPFGITQYVNRAHVRIYGVEANAHWKFAPNWKVWTSLAYAHGRDTDEDTPLNSVPPLKGIFGLGYDTGHWGTDVSLVLAAARNDVEDPTSDLNKTPGYGVVNLTGWWQPEQVKGLKIQAGIFNIFDKKYWNAIDIPDSSTFPKDYYTAPGRNMKVAVNYRF